MSSPFTCTSREDEVVAVRITYDPEVDALYIKLRDGVARTERLSEDVAIDYDAEGAVTGIEILSAKQSVFADSDALEVSFQKLATAAR